MGGEVSPTFDQIGEGESKGEKKKKKGEEKEKRRRKRKKGKGKFSQRFNGRSSTIRELNSVHTTRATCGYQNQWVSLNSKR